MRDGWYQTEESMGNDWQEFRQINNPYHVYGLPIGMGLYNWEVAKDGPTCKGQMYNSLNDAMIVAETRRGQSLPTPKNY